MSDADRSIKSNSRGTPTIYDVAREARVSSQTVSRYFSGYEGIRPGTRLKVELAAAALNYRPNLTARLLASGKSSRIGALAHELSEVGSGKVLEAASTAAGKAGYLLDIVSLDVKDPESVSRAIALLDQHELAGIIAFAPTDRLLKSYGDANFRVPMIIDSDRDDLTMGDNLSADGASQILAVEHLLDLGHVSFAYIAGPQGWISARNRHLGFEQALASRGLGSMLTAFGDWSAASGYEIGREIAGNTGITAVVAANDQMALGAINALSQAGRSVPSSVSVIGFDDIPESGYFLPPLTTVRQDFVGHGEAVVAKLLALIDSDWVGTSSVDSVQRSLVIRSSTAPPQP